MTELAEPAPRTPQAVLDYQRVAAAIAFLLEKHPSRPSLSEVARAVQLSPVHFDRLFSRWAGLSPEEFLQHLRSQYDKTPLRADATVLRASHASGLSAGGHWHDLLLITEALTPGDMKRRGSDLRISWGLGPSPFGWALLAETTSGICALQFCEEREVPAARLSERWPKAQLSRDDERAGASLAKIFAPPSPSGAAQTLRLFLSGTRFQLQVWQALLACPPSATTSYQAVAEAIGRPYAHRAVGTAVGRNPIGWLIPCHRVLRVDGGLGGYRWGSLRKFAMLLHEHRKTEP